MASIRMQTNRLRPGMIINSDVYTRAGVVIVPEGTAVTKEVHALLARHFVDEVLVEYVPEKKSGTKKTEKTVVAKQRKRKEFTTAFHIAEESLSQNLTDMVQQEKEIDVPALLDIVQSVVSKADTDADLCEMLSFMEASSEKLYAHAIHVALYGRLLAGWVQLTSEDTELVVLTGLLHDIGHLKGMEKAENSLCLHEELEKGYREKHPHDGYKIIQNKALDYRIKQAVLTHHERMDGSGFPMGVTYSNINQVARVVAIADTYATLSMEEEGYSAISPFEILNLLHTQELGKYDSGCLMAFMEHIAQNFIQHRVLLTDGRTGCIVMLNKLDLTKPLVQVEDYFVDLSVQKDLRIEKVLD